MNKHKYDKIENSYPVYHPRLIRGLKESCLVRLIKPEDILELRIVPSQRK